MSWCDRENGLWAGDKKVTAAPSMDHTWVTAMAKGKKGGFALKGGNAQVRATFAHVHLTLASFLLMFGQLFGSMFGSGGQSSDPARGRTAGWV